MSATRAQARIPDPRGEGDDAAAMAFDDAADEVGPPIDVDDDRLTGDGDGGDEARDLGDGGDAEAAGAHAGAADSAGRHLVLAACALALANLLLLAVVGVGWAFLITHIAVVSLALCGWYRMQADDFVDIRWRLLALVTAAFGPLGVAGAAAVVALTRTPAAGDRPAWTPALEQDGDMHAFERAEANVEAALARRSPVVPFTDVLANGSIEQKQEMVSVIATNFQPSFARALRGAMNDAEPAVRMMAAAAAARIEGEFLDTSMALEGAWAERATDPHRALQLARHYDAFAATDLLDESRANEARQRALEMYELAAGESPQDAGIAQAVVRLLLKLGREEEAIGLYHRRMQDGSAPPALASWYLECLFRRRRFAELRQHAIGLTLRLRDLDTLHPRSVDAMRLWAMGSPRSRAVVPVDVLVDEPLPENASARPEAPRRAKFELPYFRPNYPG